MSTLKSMIATAVLIASTAIPVAAQHRHFPHTLHHYYPHTIHVTKYVSRPVTVSRTTNRLSKKDRFEMALAYLKNNKCLTIGKYSKITGLSSAIAEAELDAFSANRDNPIVTMLDGKKKVYVLSSAHRL